jgi:hypothetical protein
MDETYHITLRLPQELAAQLRAQARQEYRSLNAEIIVLLLRGLTALAKREGIE